MQKRSSISGGEIPALHGTEETEEETVDEAVGDRSKNPAAVALGRLGGLKGGPARALKLTAEERSQVARRAAQARWSTKSEGKGK